MRAIRFALFHTNQSGNWLIELLPSLSIECNAKYWGIAFQWLVFGFDLHVVDLSGEVTNG